MTPQEYRAIANQVKTAISALEQIADTALANAQQCPQPANLRPATRADLQTGNIIWYDWGWAIIAQTYFNKDVTHYRAEDGERYNLDAAYVEDGQ